MGLPIPEMVGHGNLQSKFYILRFIGTEVLLEQCKTLWGELDDVLQN